MSPSSLLTKKWRYSLAVLSGALVIACQPPVGLFFLAYVALVPLLWSLQSGEGRRNFTLGFVSGIVAYTGLIYWVVVAMNGYGGMSIPLSLFALLLLVLYLSLYTGCFTWLVSYLDSRLGVPFYLSAPPLWALLEYVRGFLLTGFPWSFLAHSQYNFLPLVQVVSLTGTYFLSFLIVAANCLIYYLLSRRRFPVLYGSAVVALFAASLVFGVVRLQEQIPATKSVAMVQGNIRQDIKFDDAYRRHILDTYAGMTLRRCPGTELVIWPETAMPFVFLLDPSAEAVRGLPATLSNHLLLGAISKDSGRRYYNTAYVIGKRGEITGSYSKNHLVPFGEYTPLRAYLPFLEKMSVASGDFFSGPNHNPIVTDVGKIGMLICYEGVFPYITNDTVRRGAEVLVNITNDAWFEKTSAPYQHFAFYIFRAVETDRFVLRSANTGISAVIDPRGRTTARTGIFMQDVLSARYSLRQTQTFYVRHGDYFLVLSLLFLSGLAVFGALRRSNPSA